MRPTGPTPSGKSFERYAKYEVAKTLGEALRLGSFPEDLLFDYEHGHLTVGGPMRRQALDLYKVKDFDELTYTDMVLSRYTCRVDPGRKAESERIQGQLEESLRKQRQQMKRLRKLAMASSFGIRDVDDLGDSKGHWESHAIYAHRSIAEVEAKRVLKVVTAARRHVSDHELLRVLRLWGFRENETRKNVMREGESYVYSDNVGATASRDGRLLATEQVRLYPGFCTLVNRWFRDHLPEDMGADFVWTSININKAYAGRLHRDGNNVGPSFLKAFGDFKGGQLCYYPDDDKGLPLEELATREDARVKLDVSKGLLLFDGNRAHEVEPFQGERFSIVFFSCARYWKLPAETQSQLAGLGFALPSQQKLGRLWGLLAPPRGLGAAGRVRKRPAAAGMAALVTAAAASGPGRRRGAASSSSAASPAGFHFWAHNGPEKLRLEEVAARYWRRRPAQQVSDEAVGGWRKKVVPDHRQRKVEGQLWSAGDAALLGPELKTHGHLVLKGPKNVVDAALLLNGDQGAVPRGIEKAGFCVVFSNRTKSYYVMWQDGQRDKAQKAFGLGNGDQGKGAGVSDRMVKRPRSALVGLHVEPAEAAGAARGAAKRQRLSSQG